MYDRPFLSTLGTLQRVAYAVDSERAVSRWLRQWPKPRLIEEEHESYPIYRRKLELVPISNPASLLIGPSNVVDLLPELLLRYP